MRHRQSGNLAIRLVLTLALVGASALILLNRQFIYDQYMATTYTPGVAMATIRDSIKLTNKGALYFNASQPLLQERSDFNNSCRSVASEGTAVLGCYASQRIYLFNINDPKLSGIKEVTAAHEMLHAAYERMSSGDRASVDALLEKQELGDDKERIGKLIEQYAKTEPGERLNELHSIIGTEIAALSPELEAHYAKYFDDRAHVVRYAASYQDVFEALQSKQDSLVSDLNRLADMIESRSEQYRSSQQSLNTDISSFNTRARSGTMDKLAYDSQRGSLESRQLAIQREYDEIQSLINDYDKKRQELAAINSESKALNRSINSSISPTEGL